MKTCLALRHVHFEDLGVFAEPLRRHDYRIRYLDTPVDLLPLDDAIDADLMVVLGGPIGAYQRDLHPWLGSELQAVAARLARELPTLGVCLGAQLMATALGADVVRATAVEMGWATLDLSAAGQSSPVSTLAGLPVLHWHGDRFDLPAGASSLASTPLCPHQAFAVGRHGLALQFHAEIDPALFEHWLVGNAAELAALGTDVAGLRQASKRYGAATVIAAQAMIDAWLEALA